MKDKYTTKDISRTLSVSERTARRYIEKLVTIDKGTLYIEEDLYGFIITKYSADNLRTNDGQPTDTEGITEFFTPDEYIEFQKRLTEYPLLKQMLNSSEEYINSLKNDLEYHRKIYQKHLDIHEKLIESIKERNFIEAKEKRLDQ